LIITHEVTNVGTDRSQLSAVAEQAKATLEVENLDAVADRGYFSSEQILACEKAGITVTLPKPMTSHSKAEGRFGKQDFRYLVAEDVYVDKHPEKMRRRRETVEHPFGTIKARMGATHFLMKTLPRVAAEMALHVLAYNMTRVINIMGTKPLIAA